MTASHPSMMTSSARHAEEPGPSPSAPARIWAVLVTFDRPAALASMIANVAAQSRPPDELIIVDNGGGAETVARQALRDAGWAVELVMLTPAENVGPAGGFGLGMRVAAERGEPEDWVLLLDDDDPPFRGDVLERLLAFAAARVLADPRCGAVGIVGTRLDRHRGRTVRLRDDELTGAVPVDAIGGNHQPLIRVSAIRRVGTYDARLFFGHEELEFFLRLGRDWSIWTHGDLHTELREITDRKGLVVTPSRQLDAADWRRYYGIRNFVWVLRREGADLAAVRVTLEWLVKVLANAPRRPKHAARHLRLTVAALRDGWTGRLGPRGVPSSDYGGVSSKGSA